MEVLTEVEMHQSSKRRDNCEVQGAKGAQLRYMCGVGYMGKTVRSDRYKYSKNSGWVSHFTLMEPTQVI
jgi:hypothetical protein